MLIAPARFGSPHPRPNQSRAPWEDTHERTEDVPVIPGQESSRSPTEVAEALAALDAAFAARGDTEELLRQIGKLPPWLMELASKEARIKYFAHDVPQALRTLVTHASEGDDVAAEHLIELIQGKPFLGTIVAPK